MDSENHSVAIRNIGSQSVKSTIGRLRTLMVCDMFSVFFEIKTVEITQKLQISRNGYRTQVYGRSAVIVYSFMRTSIVLLT